MTATGGAGNPFELLAGLRELAEAPVTQVETVVREVRARREQVAAFQTQLALLDEQLEALETALRPLAEWGRAWTGMQRTLLGPLAAPPDDAGPAGGGRPDTTTGP